MKTKIKNKLSKTLALAFLVFMILFSVQANALPLSEIFDIDFDTQINTKMDPGQISTSTISVINRTEVVFTKSYGEQTNLENIYPLYSINKVIIGTAVLQLVEEGLIDINADINDYLPYIIQNPNFPESTITCKHLLSHRSGINDRVNETVFEVFMNSTIPFPDYIYEFLSVNGSLYDSNYWGYQPGEDYTYASLDFEILSYIIEIVTGTSILDYIQTNILDTLEMTKTKNSYSDYNSSEITIPYLWDPISSTTKQMVPFDMCTSADYKTTASDLSKFLVDLMNGYSYGNSILLNSTTINEYMFNHQGAGHGLGIFVDWDDQNWEYKGYFGNGPGYTSFMFFKDGIGVVCFVNQGAFTETLTVDFPLLSNIIQYYLYIFDQALRINDSPPLNTDENSFYFVLVPLFLIIMASFSYMKRKRK